MSVSGNFRKLKDTVSSALIGTTRAAGQISNEDLAFHRSSNPQIATLLDQQSARLLKLAHGLTEVTTWGTEVTAPGLADAESIDENWEPMVDVFDNLLEKADACLDEFTGSIKRLSPGLEEAIKNVVPTLGKHKNVKNYRGQDMPKPQLLFRDAPSNNEKTPFRPLLQTKPHAVVPLEESPSLADSDDRPKQYKHPYELEIKTARYPPSTSVKADPIPYLSFENTRATFVDTFEEVEMMLADLKEAKEIAIDLEHHDEHSYTGMVSLMQISTRTKDWVVDTLKPWRKDLQVLNEVFTDPNILKVLHGAFMDIVWLQRDLGLYVVNLFDTFHASRALGYPQKSLAYLLKIFANVDAAKQYQMADWRTRPLPEEMFNYARSDTHYLLYIFDNLRNALIDRGKSPESGETLIETVMKKSKEVSLQRYERSLYDFDRGLGPGGWYPMLCRTPALFTREQFAVFRAVHQWRDDVARHEDESVQTVMPKHVLYNIARETPMDILSLLGCSHPMSLLFQKRKGELLGIVKRAKVLGAKGPGMKELMYEIDTMLDQSATRTKAADIPSANSVRTDIKPLRSVEQSQISLPLRSNSSSFWGPDMSNIRLITPMIDHQCHSLTLPLPPLTAEVFEETGTTTQVRKTEAESSLDGPIDSPSVNGNILNRSEISILKDDSGPRKRKATIHAEDSAVPPINGDTEAAFQEELDDLPENNTESERKRAKAERKAEKKRLRKTKTDEADHNDDTVEAFDYANAPSILHAKRSGPAGTASPHQGFNPYAKSMDAPKGMRKTKTEVPGKSHTFTS